MLRRITICALAISTLFSCGVMKKQTPLVPTTEYSRMSSGLEYKYIKKATQIKKTSVGSSIEINIITSVADSVIFDSKKINNNQPVPAVIAAPTHNGDLNEGFAMMSPGDIMVFRTLIDSAVRMKKQWPPFAKSGDYMSFNVEMVSSKTKAELDQEAKMATINEEKEIKKYITDNKLEKQVKKTDNGLYYVLTKEGTGPNAKAGQKVSMNYTGYLLNGNVFDSNTDPQFKHVQPLEFPLGKGSVIKGWDEGITYLNKGAQAKFIIPSRLGYGARSPGAKIPANSVLVFDVELLDAQETPKAPKVGSASEIDQEKAIAAYLKTNKLVSKVKRTPSGLYYIVTKKGKGANAMPGQTVSMNYTGSLLSNGSVFDSNVDPKFNHVKPFEFPLGQGRVIKGWDEGIALLNPGSKARLIIPSRLGYGTNAAAGGKIPANSILIFDVEMLETK